MTCGPQAHDARLAAVLIAGVTVLAVVANVAFVWPQAIKVARTHDVAGISASGWTMSAVLFGIWATYAFAVHFMPLLIANLSGLTATAVILMVGTASGWQARWAVLSGIGVLAAVLVALTAPVLLAVIMTVSGVALRLPQLVALVRSDAVSGVSPVTWWLSCVTTGSWLVVSWDRGATTVVVASASALATSALILMLLYRRRAQSGLGQG